MVDLNRIFPYWLGSHVMHVANAYRKDVWFNVVADAHYMTKIGVDISDGKAKIGGSVEYVWQFAERNGFTKLAPGTFLQFKPKYDDEGFAYVNAFSEDGSIASSFPVTDNHSVIIDANGYIQNTKMGTIWTDVSEKVHK